MYLKNKWNDIGIKKKLFIISASLILVTSIVIYTVLFLIVPKVYISIKENSIKNSTEQIISKLEKGAGKDYLEEINKYSYDNSAMVTITTLYGELVYASNNFLLKPSGAEDFNRVKPKEFKKAEDDIAISKQFYFKDIGKDCIINVHVPIKIFNDTKRIMIRILPLILLITISIGILSAYIYSTVISKPLLKINDVAKKISKLKFDERLNFSGDDEIAQLSNSINLISTNLQETIVSLEDANKELLTDIEKEKLQDKRRRDFIKAISHELKTPITVINGQIEGMIYNIGPYKDRDKYLKESLESVLELKSLVYEIINLAKYEESISLKKEGIALNALVKEVVNSYSYLEDKKGLNIIIKEDENLIVNADRNIVKKVLSNLIKNSLNYTLDNTDIVIEIKNNYSIKIINKCNNITKENKNDLFKAFYRIDESRNRDTGGNGLGLYIVKTLLDMHGDIKYDVDLDDGLFIFNLTFKENN
ncbi:MAG: HAMP domain-containing protein [Clostridium baratii]|uniref:histidine kinase n=1 Tax=Clostridium baratii str. Sullivan TaxID=1415775 RepID=A0A0A7FYU8_9CLOT|nr:ATP-binding protein [Clostridium baratii]AIY84767.1 HAMP domain protein [Clostridium baratii str. Sullivan]MBS6005590.1 HAMP domain-containing protein [Clostridium baratii]MDU1052656.1 ATP-binding protein [Clostridium baratii]MDU4910152.1 ATP-binding protein [Clostridium baratii]CUP29595.1 sensor histidine kinase [Clostridium baratii]